MFGASKCLSWMCVPLRSLGSLETRAQATRESAQTKNVLKEKEKEEEKKKKEKRTGPFCRDCAALAGRSLKRHIISRH